MAKGKKKTKAKKDSASRITLPEDLPTLREVQVKCPGLVPPDPQLEETWDPLLVGCTTLDTSFKEAYPGLIYAMQGAMTPQECTAWIQFAEATGFSEAKHAATAGIAHRDNGRLVVHSEEIAHTIWLRMREFVPQSIQLSDGTTLEPKGCASNIRLYRYLQGQRFGKHYDESQQDPATGLWSEYTLLFYLNGGDLETDSANSSGLTPEVELRGGATVFYKGSLGNTACLSMEPRMGWCLFHGHGERCMIHEGAPVTQGTKYLLRTDILYGPVP